MPSLTQGDVPPAYRDTVREQIIRTLTPFVMSFARVERGMALEFLAKLTPDERHALWKLKGLKQLQGRKKYGHR